jgi:hypothetical protein
LDSVVLEGVINSLEGYLITENMTLSPRNKAAVIEAMYEIGEEDGIEISAFRNRVIAQLIKFIVK